MDIIETNLRRALIARKLVPAARRKQAEAMFPPEPSCGAKYSAGDERQPVAPMSEESEEANTNEPLRQNMQHKSPQELIGPDRHLSLLVAVSVVFPSEGDLAVRQLDE